MFTSSNKKKVTGAFGARATTGLLAATQR